MSKSKLPQFPIKIFAGSSHPELGKAIANELKVYFSKMNLSRFACNEIYAKPLETVRGCDVFIVQTCTQNVNEDYMELFIILDALKRSFARRIHVVIPYYGYARQDRVAEAREPISAKLMADLISASGADHVITIHLHSDQEQGFFDFPVDNISMRKLFADYFKKKKLEDITVVSPDAGGAKEAKKFAVLMDAKLAVLYKSRPEHNISKITHVVGDVRGRTCIIYDDIIDTAGTVCNGKEALIREGANKDVYLAATHPVFSKDAVLKLKRASFKDIVVTDTIPIPKEKTFKGLKILSVAPILAKVIRNVHAAKSVSGLWS